MTLRATCHHCGEVLDDDARLWDAYVDSRWVHPDTGENHPQAEQVLMHELCVDDANGAVGGDYEWKEW